MLETLVILVIIASIVLFFRAGRRNTIAYRNSLAKSKKGYSIHDHPCTSEGAQLASDYHHDSRPHNDWTRDGADVTSTQSAQFEFGGGDFGGAGAGDSYDTGACESPPDGSGADASPGDSSSDSSSSDSSSSDNSSSCDSPAPSWD